MKKLYILSLSLLFAQSIKSSDKQELALLTKTTYHLRSQFSSTLEDKKIELKEAEKKVTQYAQSLSKTPEERVNATEAALLVLAEQLKNTRIKEELNRIAQKHMLEAKQTFPCLFPSFQKQHAESYEKLKFTVKIFTTILKKHNTLITEDTPLSYIPLGSNAGELINSFRQFNIFQTQSNIHDEQAKFLSKTAPAHATISPSNNYVKQLEEYYEKQDEKRKKFNDTTQQALKRIKTDYTSLQGNNLLLHTLHYLYAAAPTSAWFTPDHLAKATTLCDTIREATQDDEYEMPEDIHTLTTQIITQ